MLIHTVHFVLGLGVLVLGAELLVRSALEEFSTAILFFVLPITIVTLVAMVIRDQQSQSGG
jgi:hypothetical protein